MVQELVGGDVDAGAWLEPLLEGAEHVEDALDVDGGLSHGLAVGAGVEVGVVGGGEGLAHGRVLRDRALESNGAGHE